MFLEIHCDQDHHGLFGVPEKIVSTINHLPRQKFIFIQAVILPVQSVVLQLTF